MGNSKITGSLLACLVLPFLVIACTPVVSGSAAGPSALTVGTTGGGILVRIDGVGSAAGGRTIVADPASLGIDSYAIRLTSEGGFATRTQTVGGTAASFADIEAGTWDLGVSALHGSAVVATGSTTGIVVAVGATATATVTLNFSQSATGTGGYQLVVAVPASAGVDYVAATLSTLAGVAVGTTQTPTLVASGTNLQATISLSSVASGTYALTLTFRKGGASGSLAGIFGEAVNVWDNVVSNKWLDPSTGALESQRYFDASLFYSSATTLSALALSDSRGALSLSPGFNSLTRGYSTSTNDSTISVTATCSYPGQTLRYRVNGSATWTALSSGTSVTGVALTTGSNTVDVQVTAADGSSQATYTTTVLQVAPGTVTYDLNGATGGTVPVDASTYRQGTLVTVLGNSGSLVKTGYAFAGWNTMTDGSGTNYAAGATLTMGSANLVLYAKWAPTYTVTYDGNGSTGGTVPVDAAAYLQGASVTTLGNTGSLAKTGYTFAGWNTMANGSGITYTTGLAFSISGNVSLYALWTSRQGVTLSIGYGISYSQLSFSPTSVTIAKGSPVAFQPTAQALTTGGTSWSWRLDGLVLAGQTGSTLNLDTSTLRAGSHSIDVYVLWQSVLYSATLALTITN